MNTMDLKGGSRPPSKDDEESTTGDLYELSIEEALGGFRKDRPEDIPIPVDLMEGDMVRVSDDLLVTLDEWRECLANIELKNDIVFGYVMTDIELITPIVQEILQDDGAEVLSVEAQAPTLHLIQLKGEPLVKELKECEVSRIVVDVLARCSNGDIVAFELQNLQDGRGPIGNRGISILSSLIRDGQIAKGSKKYELARTVGVFLVGYEWDSEAPAMESFVMTSRQRRVVLTEAQEIIIVKYRHFEDIHRERMHSLCSMLAGEPTYGQYAGQLRGRMMTVKGDTDVSKEVLTMSREERARLEMKEYIQCDIVKRVLGLLHSGTIDASIALGFLLDARFTDTAAKALLLENGYSI